MPLTGTLARVADQHWIIDHQAARACELAVRIPSHPPTDASALGQAEVAQVGLMERPGTCLRCPRRRPDAVPVVT